MREIEGTQPPAPSAACVLYIRWPKLKAPLSVTMLAERPVGLSLHFMVDERTGEGRSRACLLPDPCPHHDHATRDGWAGYVPVMSHLAGEMAIVPFSLDAWERLCIHLIGAEPVRGTKWRLTREGNKPNGPYGIFRETATVLRAELPRCPDIRPHLRAIYGPVAQLRAADPGLSDELGGIS